MKKDLKVIVCRTNGFVEISHVEDKLETWQKIVDGYIEIIRLPVDEDICIILNEEGKLLGLEPNILLPEYQDMLMGNIVFAADNGKGGFKDLSDKQIATVLNYIDDNWFTIEKFEEFIKQIRR